MGQAVLPSPSDELMAVNQVIYHGQTLIDLTEDTVTEAALLSGYTAHNAAGEPITGTASGGGGAPQTITAGDTPVLVDTRWARAESATALTATGIAVTVPRAGTYRFKWGFGGGSSGWSSYTVYSQLYRNGSAVGTQLSVAGTTQASLDLACEAGDTVEIYLRGYNYAGLYGDAGGLAACIQWDNGF